MSVIIYLVKEKSFWVKPQIVLYEYSVFPYSREYITCLKVFYHDLHLYINILTLTYY